MTERISPEELKEYLKETKDNMISKCLRLSGSKPAYYFIEQLNYGDRHIVFYPNSKEPSLELTRNQFFRMFVTFPPEWNTRLQEIWNSYPEYSR